MAIRSLILVRFLLAMGLTIVLFSICIFNFRYSIPKTKIKTDAFRNISIEKNLSKTSREPKADRPIFYKCQGIKKISITFDDGPTKYTSLILESLRHFKVKATFFVLGSNLQSEENKQLLKQIFADGHTIGSHGFSHARLTHLSKAKIEEEMNKTSTLIHNIIGVYPRLMRPPFGSINQQVSKIIHDLGYEVVLWNFDTRDWQHCSTSPEKILNKFQHHMNQSSRSFIVLQHDSYQCTALQQYQIFKYLQQTRYNFVPLNICIDAKFEPYM